MEDMRERNIVAILARGFFRYRKRAIYHVRKSPTPSDINAGDKSGDNRTTDNNGSTSNNQQGGKA